MGNGAWGIGHWALVIMIYSSPCLPISLSPHLPISLSPHLPISLSPYLPISPITYSRNSSSGRYSRNASNSAALTTGIDRAGRLFWGESNCSSLFKADNLPHNNS